MLLTWYTFKEWTWTTASSGTNSWNSPDVLVGAVVAIDAASLAVLLYGLIRAALIHLVPELIFNTRYFRVLARICLILRLSSIGIMIYVIAKMEQMYRYSWTVKHEGWERAVAAVILSILTALCTAPLTMKSMYSEDRSVAYGLDTADLDSLMLQEQQNNTKKSNEARALASPDRSQLQAAQQQYMPQQPQAQHRADDPVVIATAQAIAALYAAQQGVQQPNGNAVSNPLDQQQVQDAQPVGGANARGRPPLASSAAAAAGNGSATPGAASGVGFSRTVVPSRRMSGGVVLAGAGAAVGAGAGDGDGQENDGGGGGDAAGQPGARGVASNSPPRKQVANLSKSIPLASTNGRRLSGADLPAMRRPGYAHTDAGGDAAANAGSRAGQASANVVGGYGIYQYHGNNDGADGGDTASVSDIGSLSIFNTPASTAFHTRRTSFASSASAAGAQLNMSASEAAQLRAMLKMPADGEVREDGPARAAAGRDGHRGPHPSPEPSMQPQQDHGDSRSTADDTGRSRGDGEQPDAGTGGDATPAGNSNSTGLADTSQYDWSAYKDLEQQE